VSGLHPPDAPRLHFGGRRRGTEPSVKIP
jgi:hypothetical protein